ncbi:hypothetical protein [Dactylosporangium sp. CA-233914]|uniref:hypothetical protein n=1 Tax=Dactylosporangium sp. CA-233914 TaxID=3239934 RepID=UPI003D93E75D
MRPTLLPGVRRLWRDERTIQLGTDPAAAIVLELRRPELARALDLLDGSRTLHGLLTFAESLGLDGGDVLELVQALRAAGMVVAAHALLPAGLPAAVGARLSVEAAAISLRLRAASGAAHATALRHTNALRTVDDPYGTDYSDIYADIGQELSGDASGRYAAGAQASSEAADGPAEAGDGPAEAGDGPAEAGDGPAEAGDGPVETGGEPGRASDGRAETRREPGRAGGGPAETRGEPIGAGGPMEAHGERSGARDGPAEAHWEPATAGGGPIEARGEPARASRAPDKTGMEPERGRPAGARRGISDGPRTSGRRGAEVRVRSRRGDPAAPGQALRTPAEVMRRRNGARVLVAGDGPLVAPLATVLAGAGVGHVDPLVEGTATHADISVGGLGWDDVSASRVLATSTAIARYAPGLDTSNVRPNNVDLVVRVGDRNPPALDRRGVRLQALTRLEVTVRLGTVLVGPLVRPAGSPCRTCLDLHRQDRDPAWPALAAQLATAPSGVGEPCSLTTVMAGAAFAADEVLSYLDGSALRTEAAIVEISRPGEFRRREWGAHPRCDCRRRRRGGRSG